MTLSRRACAAWAAGAALVLSGVATPAVATTGAAPPSLGRAASRATASQQFQHVKVSWKGDRGERTNDAVIPGIGTLQLICQPNKTMIELYTPNRGYETQMWMQKYERKNGRNVVSSKEARIYRWANANDDGDGGTGSYAHEGLNRDPGVEPKGSGYMSGIISQQSSRSQDGPQLVRRRPVTTFELTWYWSGFGDSKKNVTPSCSIDAMFTTKLNTKTPANTMGLTWHGDDHAAGRQVQDTTIPAVAKLDLTCRTTRTGERSFTVTPYNPGTADEPASLYVETVTGEGPVTDHRETADYAVDDATGSFPPVPLPSNGSIRMKISNGNGHDRWVLISSYAVTNNTKHPELNLCEVAAGPYDARLLG